jgi:glycosyltransferase involved in cell wall biosynthesis
VVPTADVAARIGKHFPVAAPVVAPWQAELDSLDAIRAAPDSRPIRVALIGRINQLKGYSVLLACARHAAKRKLPLEFVVIGFTKNDNALLAIGNVFITGAYQEAELSGLIRREQPHVFFFPTMGPETWCYTLTAAIETGLPILGFEIGAVGERLQGLRRARLIAYDSTARTCNHQLLNLAGLQSGFRSAAGRL